MVKLFEEEHEEDISNATHDRPIPSIGIIFNIISKSHSQCIDLCFLKLNIGNKYGLCSELKKCPGIVKLNLK
jgi:hypothetical protein